MGKLDSSVWRQSFFVAFPNNSRSWKTSRRWINMECTLRVIYFFNFTREKKNENKISKSQINSLNNLNNLNNAIEMGKYRSNYSKDQNYNSTSPLNL